MTMLAQGAAQAPVQVPLPLPVAVAGTGVHLPDEVVTNADLAREFATRDEWIVRRTGIRERRRLAADRATSDMCVDAARQALAAAGVAAADLDAIVLASYTPDQPLPSTAMVVAAALGAHRALPLDLTQAACVGGVQAVFVGAHLLQNPAMRTVLLLGADCASRPLAPDDRLCRVFFGDAAGAAVLTRSDDGGAGLLSWDLGSELSYAVAIKAGGSRMPTSPETLARGLHHVEMDGPAVWDTATAHLPDSIRQAARGAGLEVTEIDHFFLHQANLNILHRTLDELGVPRERAPITLDRLGNTGAAGMFTAMHEAMVSGRLRPGDTYALSGIGAGFQWGTLCFRHA